MVAVLEPRTGHPLMWCADPPDIAASDDPPTKLFMEEFCKRMSSDQDSCPCKRGPEDPNTSRYETLAGFATTYVEPICSLGQIQGFLAIARREAQ